MTQIVEDRPGELLQLKGSDCDLTIDSQRGELVFTRHHLIRRSKSQVFRLDDLVDLRLRVAEKPALTMAFLGNVLKAGTQAMHDGLNPDVQALSDGSARQLFFRIRTRNGRGGTESMEERLSVDSVVDYTSGLQLATKLRAVSGLGVVDFFALPECGIELLFRPGDTPSASNLPLPHNLDAAPPPPCEPSEFQSDHRVVEWFPGETVRLHNPMSKGAPVVLLFSLFCLTGCAISLYQAMTGDPESRTVFFIIAAFGLVFGGATVFILSLLLPHTVVFDWAAGEIREETLFKKRAVPFNEIERLELEAKKVEVPSGDSGSNTRFIANLRAVRRDPTTTDLTRVPLVSTDNLRNADEPPWMALPLLYGLANAMEVEAKFLNYSSEENG